MLSPSGGTYIAKMLDKGLVGANALHGPIHVVYMHPSRAELVASSVLCPELLPLRLASITGEKHQRAW